MCHIYLILPVLYVEAQVKFHCDPCQICVVENWDCNRLSHMICPLVYDSSSVPCRHTSICSQCSVA